ncbi:MAG: hypothetical protein IT204_22375 [Fimbriimonadaceae bacterium]|nr:hypothetical protein [Fimbriimonadaceae bacterium]
MRDAAACGFDPEASGLANTAALQAAVDGGGCVWIGRPGLYRVAGTVYLGSHTALRCAPGVVLRKVPEAGPFSHVLLNRGARQKQWDEDILVEGLTVECHGVDVRTFADVFGLHGQLAFHYVRDLRIDRFRCADLGPAQYGIHICTFEDVLVNDVHIAGAKDGVHFGRGKRFRVSNGVFRTYDDAVALNAHDYDVGNPELGWIEDGIVENCHDLPDGRPPIGYFCRILAGGWIDWIPDMGVQKSDTVVHGGRLYRVRADADERVYPSRTPPTHAHGSVELDGITWVAVQDDVTYTAGVRNVVFRDIFLHKPRVGFSVHFDVGRYSRSYYPGAPVPRQERLLLDNVRVLHDERVDLLSVGTPVDVLTVVNSQFGDTPIRFHGNRAMDDYGRTQVNLIGNTFTHGGPFDLLLNSVPGKRVRLRTAHSTVLGAGFAARVDAGPGQVEVASDLPGIAP